VSVQALASAAAAWQSPVTRRALTWDPTRHVFAGAPNEVFGCLADDIPDFRPGGVPLAASEIGAIRAGLERRWLESEARPLPPQRLSLVAPAAARRFWRGTTRVELVAFLRWCARGRPPYTQRDSMRLYEAVADVYPNALRSEVAVLTDGRLATAPLALFKRLSLQPVIDLIRRERVRSVLDFGCGWGINTLLLRQLFPDLEIRAFDYSPQRMLATQFNLERAGTGQCLLFVGDGSRLPLRDASVDLVLTAHVLEQMDEVLPAALAEIRRVALRFAVHIEPSWRWARWPHRLRVRRMGYPRNITGGSTALGWRVLEHRPAEPAWGKTPGELIVLGR
jgi:SAM-dependent methyltransferase